MDFHASLRRAMKSGKVLLGRNITEQSIKAGEVKLVVLAANCPGEFRERITGAGQVPIHVFDGSSVQLGKACGKPFMVSALAVIDAGESDILTLARA